MSKHLERVAALLNQAENAGTEAEAQAFMDAVQRLSSLHQIDVEKARAVIGKRQATAVPEQRTIKVGERGTKGLRTYVDLVLGIADANSVKCTIAHDATRVHAYGFADDIDLVEALFASLLTQMVTASEDYKKSGAYKAETTYRASTYKYVFVETGKRATERDYYYGTKRVNEIYVPSKQVPVPWLSARLEFQDAFSGRIASRLRKAAWEAREESEAAERDAVARRQLKIANPHLDDDGKLTIEFVLWFYETNNEFDLLSADSYTQELVERLETELDNTWTMQKVRGYAASIGHDWAQDAPVSDEPGTALVLANKEKEVGEFYSSKTSHVRGSYRGHQSTGASSGSRAAGRAAGDSARIGSQAAFGGARAALAG